MSEERPDIASALPEYVRASLPIHSAIANLV